MQTEVFIPVLTTAFQRCACCVSELVWRSSESKSKPYITGFSFWWYLDSPANQRCTASLRIPLKETGSEQRGKGLAWRIRAVQASQGDCLWHQSPACLTVRKQASKQRLRQVILGYQDQTLITMQGLTSSSIGTWLACVLPWIQHGTACLFIVWYSDAISEGHVSLPLLLFAWSEICMQTGHVPLNGWGSLMARLFWWHLFLQSCLGIFPIGSNDDDLYTHRLTLAT
jgi:hypothetical protein